MAILFTILCILHFGVLFLYPDHTILRFVTKGLPVAFLILSLFQKTKLRSFLKKTVAIGLIFSLAGDSFLVFEQYFLPGLVMFLLAHILYSLGFTKSSPPHWIRLVPFAALGGLIFLWIRPGIGEALLIPVAVYTTVISVMGWRAFARSEAHLNSYYAGLLGAVLFMMSDSLLAVGKFGNFSLVYHSFWVMLTYYAAQFLICKSALTE